MNFRLFGILLLVAASGMSLAPKAGTSFDEGFATIVKKDVGLHLVELASPHLEGRDTPSRGQDAAAEYIIERFREAGVEGAGPDGAYRLSFAQTFTAPDPKHTSLSLSAAGDEPRAFELGVDFVPLPGGAGGAEGEVLFAGFGITDSKERYDDLASLSVKGKVVVIVEGEPRHRRLFDGEEISVAADVLGKVEELRKAKVAAILVVRRPPAEPAKGWDGEPVADPALGYRYTWAQWNPRGTGPMPRRRRNQGTPVFEITPEAAREILGEDVLELARKIDRSGKPIRKKPTQNTVTLKCAFTSTRVDVHNVVGILRGDDEKLAEECVVLGAHYDHLGVDPWGRIAYGADDNGSGVAAILELADALAIAQPRRSILFCCFTAEEDGLHGSEALVANPPVPIDRMVAMLNLDQIGRGDAAEVVALGCAETPAFHGLLKRAVKLKSTRIKNVITNRGEHLWRRSDHYPFHEKGVPSLFFFEASSETKNPDYHTYRDTVELVDLEKVVRTARLGYNLTWILANDDERPPSPRD